MNTLHARWLAEQLPAWEREGLVSPEAARTLRDRYLPPSRAGAAQVVVGAVGGLLVGAGIISILASNWDDLPRWTRLVLALAPLAVTQLVGARLVARGPGAAPWMSEAAALAQAGAVGAALALVSQIYHLPGEWTGFLFWWCVLCVPLAWVHGSCGVAIAYAIGIAVWAVGRVGDDWMLREASRPDLRLWFPALALGILPLWPGAGLRARPPVGARWVLAMAGLAGLLAVAASTDVGRDLGGDGGWFWSAMLSAAVVLLFPLEPAGIGEPLARKPQVVVGGLALSAMALAATYEGPARELLKSVVPTLSEPWTWALVSAVAALSAVAVRQERFAILAVAALAAVPPLLAAVSLSDDGWPLAIAYSAVVLAISVVLIGLEFAGRQGAARIGATLLCILLFLRMADADLSLLTKGVAFVVIGAGFLGFNLLVSRRRLATPEARSP